MSAAIAMPGNTASTFLTHFFGSGLSDDRYVVERFKAMIDGEIRRCTDPTPAKGKGRRKAGYVTANLKAVKEMSNRIHAALAGRGAEDERGCDHAQG